MHWTDNDFQPDTPKTQAIVLIVKDNNAQVNERWRSPAQEPFDIAR